MQRKLKLNITVKNFRAGVEGLENFSDIEINLMVDELPRYFNLVQNIPENPYNWNNSGNFQDEMDTAVKFWKIHKNDIPGLAKFARYAFTICTSSASAERSFSVLKRCFGDQQRLALEDYVMLSCMLQCNRK